MSFPIFGWTQLIFLKKIFAEKGEENLKYFINRGSYTTLNLTDAIFDELLKNKISEKASPISKQTLNQQPEYSSN